MDFVTDDTGNTQPVIVGSPQNRFLYEQNPFGATNPFAPENQNSNAGDVIPVNVPINVPVPAGATTTGVQPGQPGQSGPGGGVIAPLVGAAVGALTGQQANPSGAPTIQPHSGPAQPPGAQTSQPHGGGAPGQPGELTKDLGTALQVNSVANRVGGYGVQSPIVSGLGGALSVYNGIKQGGVAGDAQALSGVGRLYGATSAELSSLATSQALANGATAEEAAAAGQEAGLSGAGQVAQAAGYIAVPLEVYNFVKNWQSGDTGGDTIRGAETGASIGTAILPGIGTVVGAVIGAAVGAISSAFGGGKADPETMMLDNYVPQFNKNPAVGSQLTPAQNFQLLAGVFDAKNNSPGHATPLEQVYGRMGEATFLNDAFKQINAAAAAGKVGANTSPQQIYDTVLQPYLATKKGNFGNQGAAGNATNASIQPGWTTAKGNQFGKAFGTAVTNLITAWQAGVINTGSQIGIDGQTDAQMPAYKGAISPQIAAAKQQAQAAAAAQQAAAAKQRPVRPNVGGGKRLAEGGEVKGYAKGGEVISMARKYMKLKGVKGYADGGDVTADDQSDTSDTSDADSNAAPAANQPSSLQSTVSRILTAFGQDPAQSTQVISALKALNPNANDDDLLTNLGKNLPTVLAAATKPVNVTTDPQKLQDQQDAVNTQRSAAAKQVQANQAHIGGDTVMLGAKLAEAYDAAPMITVNAGQTNVDSSAKTQNQALVNQGQDITNQQGSQTAQQQGVKTKEAALGLGLATQASDPGSTVSTNKRSALIAYLSKKLGKSFDPSTLSGLNAAQLDAVVTGMKLGADVFQTDTAGKSNAAVAAKTAAETPYEQARSNIASRADQQDAAAGGGAAGGTSGESDDTTFGAPNRAAPSPIAASISGPAAARTAQNQSNQAYGQSLAQGATSRSQAEQNLDEMITQVEGIKGPIGPGTGILDKIDPKRQVYEKLSQQYLAALGGQTDSARAGIAAGFPQLDRINDKTAFIKQLHIAKARLLKADALSNEYQRRGSGTGDFGDLNPGAAYNGMKSYAFIAPDGHTVDVKAYGSTKSEQLRLGKDVLAAKQKGLTLQSADQ